MICTNKCHSCSNIIYVNTPVISNNNLEIAIPNETIQNNELVCFIITGNIPASENPLPIKLIINGTSFSYINKCGNYVYSDQIKTRTLYISNIKTDSLLAKNVKCNLYPTKAVIPCINAPAPVTPQVKEVIKK